MDQKALWKITYGMYLLAAHENGRDNGCIINTAVQVAEHPVRISVSVSKGGCTHDMMLADGRFSLSMLTEDADFALFRHFGMQSGRDTDKLAGRTDIARSEGGLLHLTENTSAWLDCRVISTVDLGTHTLFIGEAVDGAVLSDRPLCTYTHYQTAIKPKPAPMKKKGWVCTVCGYVYEGDEVPDDFVCPLCKHGKADFVLQEEPAQPAPQEQAPAKWVCTVCGYVHEGDAPPEVCPLCKMPADKFVRSE